MLQPASETTTAVASCRSKVINIVKNSHRCSSSARNPQSFVMIAPVRCRSMRIHGEAARLLGSQKSRRFCRIAKSPTSFDPASIASGCRQPLMSAPASVPRVARPSEATAFARSVHPSPVPHTSLMSSSSYCALFSQLRPRHSSRYYRLSKVTVRGGEAGSPSCGICWGGLPRV